VLTDFFIIVEPTAAIQLALRPSIDYLL